MYDERMTTVDIHGGRTADHVVITAMNPSGNGFLVVHATFEGAPISRSAETHPRFSLINPVFKMAWTLAEKGDMHGYGSYWSFYIVDRIERWEKS